MLKLFIPYQKFRLFVDRHKLLALLIALALLLIIYMLISPILLPTRIPQPIADGSVVVHRPLYVVPNKRYVLNLRASDKNTTFSVSEGNDFVIIHDIEEFQGPTYRVRVTLEAAAPSRREFAAHYADVLIVVANDEGIDSERVSLPINSFILPLQVAASALLSVPVFTALCQLVSGWLAKARKPR
jgi:hypothetical protein